MNKNKKLILQIEKTLETLKNKKANDKEEIIDNYIKKYSEALIRINNEPKYNELKFILNIARGYMETSSNYEQDFLLEMSKTEKLIKKWKKNKK